MNAVHKRALNFAASHFAISLTIGLVCLLYFYGAGLSDTYQPDPPWIKALRALLWVLQTPAAAFETLALRHSQHGANVLFLCALGVLWSLALGYAVPWIKRALSKDRSGSN
jgi:hypothetical protein